MFHPCLYFYVLFYCKLWLFSEHDNPGFSHWKYLEYAEVNVLHYADFTCKQFLAKRRFECSVEKVRSALDFIPIIVSTKAFLVFISWITFTADFDFGEKN